MSRFAAPLALLLCIGLIALGAAVAPLWVALVGFGAAIQAWALHRHYHGGRRLR